MWLTEDMSFRITMVVGITDWKEIMVAVSRAVKLLQWPMWGRKKIGTLWGQDEGKMRGTY